MCGRTRCTLAPDQVVRATGTSRWVNPDDYRPSYNASPGFSTPVVRMASDGPQIETMRRVGKHKGRSSAAKARRPLRWGLVPSFTKKEDKPDFFRMFNARSETVAEKPSFRRLVPTRRCLVLVDGFYEWQAENGGVKQPYYIHLAGDEPLVMAGLWDVWEGPEGPMHTYTILTTDSSKRLQWLHDRMPVILRDREAQQLWLDTTDSAAMGKLLRLCEPYNGEDLVWHPVTRQMNVPSFQGPECCKEVKKPKVQDFFKPRSAPAAAAAAEKTTVKGEPAMKHEEQHGVGAAGTAAHAEAAVKEEGGASPGRQQRQAAAAASSGREATAAAVNADEQPAERGQAAAASAAGEQAAAQAAAAPTPQSSSPQQHATPQKQPRQQNQAMPQKRKQGCSAGKGSGSKGSGAASAKKAKPAGQPGIAAFFSKA